MTLTATVTNTAPIALRDTVLYLAVDGTGRPSPAGQPGARTTATRSWRTRLADDAEGLVSFTAHALFDVHRHGSDCVRASSSVRLPSRSLASAFDNAGIASDDALTVADIDGSRSSLSAQALASVGLTPGAVVTYDGVAFTWPDTEPGNKDNVVASGQTVLLSGAGSRLAFLGTSTWGEGKGEGTVVYADGTRQAFSVAVPDWYGANSSAAVVVPYRHISTGRDDTPVSLYTFGVELRDKEVRAVVLPKVSDGVAVGRPRSAHLRDDGRSERTSMDNNEGVSRRRVLTGAAAMGGALLLAPPPAARAAAANGGARPFDTAPAAAALRRLVPAHHQQVTLRAVAADGGDHFRVTGRTGSITVEGTSPAVLLTGFNRYLAEAAKADISWNGEQLNLPRLLPAPGAEIKGAANVAHRFAYNDTNEGYTGAYRGWKAWEREIDVLALHGINEVLVYIGADAVYYDTFRDFGYSDAELRAWIPAPSHQPWWLLQNMSGFGGPVSKRAHRPAGRPRQEDHQPGAGTRHDARAARLLRHRAGRLLGQAPRRVAGRPGHLGRLQAPRLARSAHGPLRRGRRRLLPAPTGTLRRQRDVQDGPAARGRQRR